MTTLTQSVARPDSFVTPPYFVQRFTVDEYHQLVDSGVIDEGDRIELLEGWIVPQVTIHPPHAWTVRRLNRMIPPLLTEEWIPTGQNPITTDDSEPEPDYAIVRGPEDRYLQRHPQGSDIGLVIEVADSTLAKDRQKATIYAAAGIPTYWIINLIDRQIERYTDPDAASRVYRKETTVVSGTSIDLTLDSKTIAQWNIDEILPPTTP